MINNRHRWIASCLVGLCGHTLFAVATDSPPTLDDLLQIEPPVPKSVAPEPGSDQAINKNVSERLAGSDVTDGLEMALREMQQAESQLGAQQNAGIETQRLQESAMSRLDVLIAEAKRQCSACKGGSGSGSPCQQESGSKGNAKGAAAAVAQQGENNQGAFSPGSVGQVGPDGRPLAQTRSEWGNLPPRLRDELIQSMKERFSLIYKSLTEAYYRRLAEEDQP